MEKYNLVVIGGGSAGLMVAAGATGLGARVALVQKGPMGGDCLNTGCVPSKALLSAAKKIAHAGMDAGKPSATPNDNREANWKVAAKRVQQAIDTIAPHDSVERFQSLGVEVFQGHGRVVGPHHVEVALDSGGSMTLRGKRLVLATGSGPLVPPIPGLQEAGYLTNETVFSMPTLPKRLLVLGAGPIGVELGQALSRLGSKVTLLDLAPSILPREDPDAAEVVAKSLEADGITLLTGMQVERVEKQGGVCRVVCSPAPGSPSTGKDDPDKSPADARPMSVEVDALLVAIGRRAHIKDLGLEETGVAVEKGLITVDDKLRTSVRSIHACGDVTGPYQFTHTANQQARVVIQNALLPFKARFNTRVVPWCTFTDPELARVGLSEAEALAKGIPHRVLKFPYSSIDRAICERETEGFLKVLTPPGRDDILGATMVGAHAGELIHEMVLAMQARLKLRDLAGTIHIYPTLAEIFRRIGDESRKGSFTPRVAKLFHAWMRWHRR